MCGDLTFIHSPAIVSLTLSLVNATSYPEHHMHAYNKEHRQWSSRGAITSLAGLVVTWRRYKDSYAVEKVQVTSSHIRDQGCRVITQL